MPSTAQDWANQPVLGSGCSQGGSFELISLIEQHKTYPVTRMLSFWVLLALCGYAVQGVRYDFKVPDDFPEGEVWIQLDNFRPRMPVIPVELEGKAVGQVVGQKLVGSGNSGKVYQAVVELYDGLLDAELSGPTVMHKKLHQGEIVAIKDFGEGISRDFDLEKQGWIDDGLLMYANDKARILVRPFFEGITLLKHLKQQTSTDMVGSLLTEYWKLDEYHLRPENIIVDPSKPITAETMHRVGKTRSRQKGHHAVNEMMLERVFMRWYRGQLALYNPITEKLASELYAYTLYSETVRYGLTSSNGYYIYRSKCGFARRGVEALGSMVEDAYYHTSVDDYRVLLLTHQFGGQGHVESYDAELELAHKARQLCLDPFRPDADSITRDYLTMLSKRGLHKAQFEHFYRLSKTAHEALAQPASPRARSSIQDFVRYLRRKKIPDQAQAFTKDWSISHKAVSMLKGPKFKDSLAESYANLLERRHLNEASQVYRDRFRISKDAWLNPRNSRNQDYKRVLKAYSLSSLPHEVRHGMGRHFLRPFERLGSKVKSVLSKDLSHALRVAVHG